MDIKRVIKQNVFIQNKKIIASGYTEDVINNIDRIISDDEKCNLLMTIDEIETQTMLLIVIAMKLYYDNLYINTKQKYSFEIEDTVWYRDKKVEYLGKEIIGNEEKIKLRYKDRVDNGVLCKDMLWINIDNCNELTPYYGETSSLNIMSIKQSKKVGCKELFAELINEPNRQGIGKSEEQVIFVFESKIKMHKILSEISMQVKGERYNFTEIFPCKYYVDEDRHESFNTNTQKEKEIFLFASRIDVAQEILLQNKNCKKIILLGGRSYENELDGILERMISRVKHKKIDSIIIYNSFNCIKSTKELINKELTVLAWCKSYVQWKSTCLNGHLYNNRFIQKSLWSNCTNILIEDIALNKVILSIRGNLIKLLQVENKIIDNDRLVRNGFKLFKILSEVAIPIKEYETLSGGNNIKPYFDSLNEILEYNKIYVTNSQLINSIINDFKELYRLLYLNNPKIKILKEISDEYFVIVCKDDYEKEHLAHEINLLKSTILTIKEFYNTEVKEKLIFTTYFNNDKIDQFPYKQCNSIYNLHYYSDAIRYNYKVSEFNKCMDEIVLKNEFKSELHEMKIEHIKLDLKKFNSFHEKNSIGEDKELAYESEKDEVLNNEENLVEKYISENLKEIYNPVFEVEINTFEKGRDYFNNKDIEGNSGISEVRKKVIFNGGCYSMLTPYYNALCKDNDGSIVTKSVDSLMVGDRIIFTNEKSEDDLAELFTNIVNSEIFKKQYKEHYDNMKFWKYVLSDYKEKYEIDCNLLAKEFKAHKVDKTAMAIKTWLSDERIIGPRDKATYKAIADIAADNRLKEEWETVFESCNIIRNFKTQFKKTFNNMVKNSFIGVEDTGDELETLVRKVFKDLKIYADIVEVKKIENVREKIPYNKTNSIVKEKDNRKYGGI